MFNTQKKYFKNKLIGVQKMIWDFEFKRAKTRSIRENIRQEYDNVLSKLDIVENKLKSQKKDPNKICVVHNPETGNSKVHKDQGTCACEYIDNHIEIGEIERFYDNIVLLERDRDRFRAQMISLDSEVNGAAPTSEYPDGIQGINDQLDALRELMNMLKNYIKSI